jgi:hypothetical protein
MLRYVNPHATLIQPPPSCMPLLPRLRRQRRELSFLCKHMHAQCLSACVHARSYNVLTKRRSALPYQKVVPSGSARQSLRRAPRRLYIAATTGTKSVMAVGTYTSSAAILLLATVRERHLLICSLSHGHWFIRRWCIGVCHSGLLQTPPRQLAEAHTFTCMT